MPELENSSRDRRVVDEIRLRELEVTTQYELKMLSEALDDLRNYVKSTSVADTGKVVALNNKVNLIGMAILAQLAGLDVELLISLISKIP